MEGIGPRKGLKEDLGLHTLPLLHFGGNLGWLGGVTTNATETGNNWREHPALPCLANSVAESVVRDKMLPCSQL